MVEETKVSIGASESYILLPSFVCIRDVEGLTRIVAFDLTFRFHRYNEALKVLELEKKVRGPDIQVSDQDSEISAAESLLLAASNSSTGSYSEQFSKFVVWVDGSLEMYRVRYFHFSDELSILEEI